MKVLLSLAAGFASGLLLQVLGAALLFGGFFVRAQYWTEVQAAGMTLTAALAGFVGVFVFIFTVHKLRVERSNYLGLLFLLFPGIRAWDYYAIGDSTATILVVLALGVAAVLGAMWLGLTLLPLRSEPGEGGRLTSA